MNKVSRIVTTITITVTSTDPEYAGLMMPNITVTITEKVHTIYLPTIVKLTE